MIKKDLVSGKHIVKTRDGRNWMVIGDTVCTENSWNSMNIYDKNMLVMGHSCHDKFDIIEVYSVSRGSFSHNLHLALGNELLWKRVD